MKLMILIIAAAFAMTGQPLAAQGLAASVGLAAGAAQYDLAGTGTAPFAAVRVEVEPHRGSPVLFEGGIGYLTYAPNLTSRRHHVLPEAMLQLQVPGVRLRPYAGVGAGLSFSNVAGDMRTDATLSAAAGLRLFATPLWAVRTELRIRAIRPWSGTTADWSIGLARVFQPRVSQTR